MSSVQTLRREGHSVSANLISSAVPMARALTNHPLVGADAASSKPARLHSMIGVAGLLALGAVAGCGSSPSPTQVDDPVDSGVTQVDTGVVAPADVPVANPCAPSNIPANLTIPVPLRGYAPTTLRDVSAGINVRIGSAVYHTNIYPPGPTWTAIALLDQVDSNCHSIGTTATNPLTLVPGQQALPLPSAPLSPTFVQSRNLTTSTMTIDIITDPIDSLWTPITHGSVNPTPAQTVMVGTPRMMTITTHGTSTFHVPGGQFEFTIAPLDILTEGFASPVNVLAINRFASTLWVYTTPTPGTLVRIGTGPNNSTMTSIPVQINSASVTSQPQPIQQ